MDDPHINGDLVALLNVEQGVVLTFLLKPIG